MENTESRRRQYELRQRALALGWPDERIVVIDNDLGLSAASAVDREGFQRLVGEVGVGRAGMVMGLEVSRLARNSSDWHRLLEICAVTQTLILDEDGLYEPTEFNDRLLLGLKGTMSEAELYQLRARLVGGDDEQSPPGRASDSASRGLCLRPARQGLSEPRSTSPRIHTNAFRNVSTGGLGASSGAGVSGARHQVSHAPAQWSVEGRGGLAGADGKPRERSLA
jgi:hypothetical protein